METQAVVSEENSARDLLRRHAAHFEVSPYYIVLDERTFGAPPIHRRIHAGFDIDLYGQGFTGPSTVSIENSDLRATLSDFSSACREVVSHSAENCTIEILPFDGTLVLDVKDHFKPEALVRIRITHLRGLDQRAGASEEKALADIAHTLESLGLRRR